MKSILAVILALGWMLVAVPANAQQDTSAMGRTGEGVTPPPGQPGAAGTDTAGMGDTGEMDDMDDMDDEGGAMPTTASPLPFVALGGAVLLAIGLGLRYARGRS